MKQKGSLRLLVLLLVALNLYPALWLRSAEFFVQANLHQIHLELTQAEWKAMQAKDPRRGGPPVEFLPKSDGGERPVHRGRFPWAIGSVTIDVQRDFRRRYSWSYRLVIHQWGSEQRSDGEKLVYQCSTYGCGGMVISNLHMMNVRLTPSMRSFMDELEPLGSFSCFAVTIR